MRVKTFSRSTNALKCKAILHHFSSHPPQTQNIKDRSFPLNLSCKFQMHYVGGNKHLSVFGHVKARAASLTSNSWGISRRARYSLASLVFISGRISPEITTYPKGLLSQMRRCREAIFGQSPISSQLFYGRIFPSLLRGPCNWIPAGDSTAPPPPQFGCVARPFHPRSVASSAHRRQWARVSVLAFLDKSSARGVPESARVASTWPSISGRTLVTVILSF